MKLVAIVLLAVSLAPFWRETNSRAANARGAKAFQQKEHVQAAGAFRQAQQLDPSALHAFNLGTAEIAAGERERGSATLEGAIRDPALRADALFNRGNSALGAQALDHAVRDYKAALRAAPGHMAAKRNLEIALQRQQEQQRSAAAGGRNDQQGQSQQNPGPAPGEGEKPQPGELDHEALLRSVQQQEQDELRRMKGKVNPQRRVGW